MIISLRLKNFFSIRDEAVIDFTADLSGGNKDATQNENLMDFSGDKFVNVIGLFGSNAAGKSNIIKAIDFCRQFILSSHTGIKDNRIDYSPFKFDSDRPSEFNINFVTDGIEYEYQFAILGNTVVSESLYHYPNKRRAKVFSRENTSEFSFRKGAIARPKEVASSTGAGTLFLSQANAMNREAAMTVYRFFEKEMAIGIDAASASSPDTAIIRTMKPILLKALEASDSDIVDIEIDETIPGQTRLISFHRENPAIPFDFAKEESDGTKRLLNILLMLLQPELRQATVFIDEFDLKLHVILAGFILDMVRATQGMQLVFTSHNTALLSSQRLRREQIIFVNKSANGNSEFIPLSDYEGLHKNTDLEKAYLQGRFDAVPYTENPCSLIRHILYLNENA